MPSCKQCSSAFEVTPEDLAFYDKISPVFNGKKEQIPPPTLCPDCRQQRRMVWRNERNLYHRKCDRTNRQIIAAYPSSTPFPVYDQQSWWKDDWDATDYGLDFDFSRPFFKQFQSLIAAVPRISLSNSNNENCEYVNYTNYSKDCYLIFGNHNSERCCYGWRVHHCDNCFDCTQLNRCRHCYDCIDCDDCYQLISGMDCRNCSDSSHLLSCRGCKSCLYCCNLQNVEYHIFNKRYEPEEFAKLARELLQDPAAAEAEYRKLLAASPRKAAHNVQCEEVSGDYLISCNNCSETYSAEKSQDCTRIYLAEDAKDCSDCDIVGWPAELCYEGISTCVNAYQNRWSSLCWTCVDVSYCDSCFHSKNLFGCVGLKNKQYCILNRQYTKEEYEALVPKIIEHMRKTGEWGEFFPVQLSPFAYNETVAHESFPLSKEHVEERGWKWREEEDDRQQYLGPNIEVPIDISAVSDDITKHILECEVTGKPYKVIPQELKFHRDMGIPLSRTCPDQRHKERMAQRNPRKLWDRACMKCQKAISTTYSPDRPEIVYCDECYLSTVY